MHEQYNQGQLKMFEKEKYEGWSNDGGVKITFVYNTPQNIARAKLWHELFLWNVVKVQTPQSNPFRNPKKTVHFWITDNFFRAQAPEYFPFEQLPNHSPKVVPDWFLSQWAETDNLSDHIADLDHYAYAIFALHRPTTLPYAKRMAELQDLSEYYLDQYAKQQKSIEENSKSLKSFFASKREANKRTIEEANLKIEDIEKKLKDAFEEIIAIRENAK